MICNLSDAASFRDPKRVLLGEDEESRTFLYFQTPRNGALCLAHLPPTRTRERTIGFLLRVESRSTDDEFKKSRNQEFHDAKGHISPAHPCVQYGNSSIAVPDRHLGYRMTVMCARVLRVTLTLAGHVLALGFPSRILIQRFRFVEKRKTGAPHGESAHTVVLVLVMGADPQHRPLHI